MNDITEAMYHTIVASMEIDFLKKAFDCACFQLECNAGRSKEWWAMHIMDDVAERIKEGEANGTKEQQEGMDDARR